MCVVGGLAWLVWLVWLAWWWMWWWWEGVARGGFMEGRKDGAQHREEDDGCEEPE